MPLHPLLARLGKAARGHYRRIKLLGNNLYLVFTKYPPCCASTNQQLKRHGLVDQVQIQERLALIDSSIILDLPQAKSEVWSKLSIPYRRLSKTASQALLDALTSPSFLTNRQINNLKQDVESIRSSKLCPYAWLVLYQLLNYRGLYTVSLLCRAKSLEVFAGLYRRNEFSCCSDEVLASAIELGRCRSVNHLLYKLHSQALSSTDERRWRLLASLLWDNAGSVNHNLLSEDDKKFGDYLQGKSIAIVGPAPVKLQDAEEIDSHDLIIRLNHSYTLKGCDPEYKGMKTHITYINGSPQGKALLDEMHGVLPDELHWAVIAYEPQLEKFRSSNPNLNLRCDINFNPIAFYGVYNMAQRVCMDICLFNPSIVKLFHIDLNLTLGRYKGYNPSSSGYTEDKAKSIYRHGSVRHDPVMQYWILKMLYAQGRLTGDSQFQRVMHLSIDDYMKELELTYYDWMEEN